MARGGLLAVAPRATALEMREALGLVLFPIDWGSEDTAVTLIWREANLGNPALAALLECFCGPRSLGDDAGDVFAPSSATVSPPSGTSTPVRRSASASRRA